MLQDMVKDPGYFSDSLIVIALVATHNALACCLIKEKNRPSD